MDDMTPDEAVLMRAHREYWTPRVETGVVVAMGPVADPAGGHGVAIIEAASTAATATGLMSKHLAQLKAFLDECFVD